MGEPGKPKAGLPVVLITGMSGAGKTTALKVFEDLGYEAVDNMPLGLAERLMDAEALHAAKSRPVALAVDYRTRGFGAAGLDALLRPLRGRSDLAVRCLFLDCDDEVLRLRFSETRHRHPLAEDRPVIDGIHRERELLRPVADLADLVIDTSHLSVADLRRLLHGHFALAEHGGLTVSLLSFSFRRGLPREADLVFDVRFLSNPHYEEALRPLDGRDKAVGEFIARDDGYSEFMDGAADLLQRLLPRYRREGKSYLTVALGCTGGRHRSVFCAEELARRLRADDCEILLRHRELEES